MRKKFIGFVYFEGRLLALEEYGDVYELDMHSFNDLPTWRLLSHSPWPEKG